MRKLREMKEFNNFVEEILQDAQKKVSEGKKKENDKLE